MECRLTGRLREDRFVTTEMIRSQSTMPMREEWSLYCLLQVKFWCATGQGGLLAAKQAAMTRMAAMIYAEVLEHEDRLRQAIDRGDREAALSICDDLRRGCLDTDKLTHGFKRT